jgi:hypothetical protein
MIGWALENVNVATRTIYNAHKVVVGSFCPEHVQVMYKLSLSFKHTYNVDLLKRFEEEECPEGVNNYPDLDQRLVGTPQEIQSRHPWYIHHYITRLSYDVCDHDAL